MRDFEWEGFRGDGPESESRTALGAVGPLVAKLFEDLQLLMRQELSLARAEIKEESARAQRFLGWMAASVILGVIALALLVLALVFAVQSIFPQAPLWGCFAAVGGLCGVIAIVIHLGAATAWEEVRLVPRRAAASIKENIQWLRRRQ